jgi:radical SAM protein (TIGR01212 family)
MRDESLPYNDYGVAMRRRFGGRVQKLSIDAAMSCPNRDGRVARGGCTFCLNEAFSPAYCRKSSSIAEQIARGIEFHANRGRTAESYIAYFQAGTNTNAPVDKLERLWREALADPRVSGMIVGTRPDCISSEILDLLVDLSTRKYVAVEYGIESTYDTTLEHVNRGHGFLDAERAVAQTRGRGLDVGAHFILGLPHESREQIIAQMERINALGLNSIKFHQLQIYRSTPMAREWAEYPERFALRDYTAEDYVDLMVDIIRRLDPSVAIERFASQAPRNLLEGSMLGGIKLDRLRAMIVARMRELGAVQGDMVTK